jgi:hypothetical protein
MWTPGLGQTQNGITVIVFNQEVTWSAQPGVDVDLVAVWRGTGTKCHYHYTEVQTEGAGLRAPQSGNPVNVAICADGDTNPGAPPEPEPDNIVTTVGDLCEASFNEEGTGTELISDPSVSFGFTAASPGQQEQVAVCAAGAQQECLANPPRRDYNKNVCAVGFAPTVSGELPLDCAPVDYETTAEGPKYCWYYENQVCDGNTELKFSELWGCSTRAPNSFRPKTEVGGIDFSVTVFDGSTTYTTCTRSRCWTSTQ